VAARGPGTEEVFARVMDPVCYGKDLHSFFHPVMLFYCEQRG
jgi:hypothetical protein